MSKRVARRDEQLLQYAGRVFSVTRFPVPLSDGSIGIGGTAVDVTEEHHARQEAEAALASATEQRALVQAVLENVPEGLTVAWGADAKISTVSKHGLELIKKSADAVVAIEAQDHPRTWEVFHPDGKTLACPDELPLTRACRGGTAHNEEWLIRDARGELIPILCDAGPILGCDGDVLGGVIAWRDIREMKAHQSREALAAAKLRAMLNNTPLAVIVWDENFNISEWSGAATQMFGYTAEEMLGRHVQHSGLVPGDEVEKVRAAQQALAVASDFVISANDNVVKSGRRISCEWYNSVVKDSSGKTLGVLSLVLDVTDRNRYERELLEADKRKDAFLALLAHELRNPLAPLRTVAQLLDRSAGSPEMLSRLTGVVDRQVSHMARLLDDLLDVSRLTLGRLSLEFADVDLHSVINDGLEQTLPLLTQANQSVAVRAPEGPVMVRGDRGRLAQCVANLLSNAARYSKGPGHVLIALELQEDCASLSVSDEGIGIPAQRLRDIFQVATEGVEESMQRGGLGLGLPLVKGLIELQGGTVSARSDGRGRGATIVITLPLTPSQS